MNGKCFAMMTLLAAGALTAPANAVMLTDDLSDGPDPISNFDFDLATSGIQGPGATGSDFASPSDSNDGFAGALGSGLALFPDAAEITFNLPPGDVLSMEITGESFVSTGGTNVLFMVDTTSGLQGFQFPIAQGPFTISSNSVVVPGGGSVLSVDSVVIDSFEARFDTITYDLVPEPTAAALLGLGGLALLRRRR